MRIRTPIPAALAALALLALASLVVPPATARAEDAPSYVWLYEVRVVRVDLAQAEGVETPAPFPELKATTLTLAWPEVLRRLQARGVATVLMDARVTALEGGRSTTTEETTTPIVGLNFEDKNNQQYRSTIVKHGCSFTQLTTGDTLEYQLQIRASVTPPKPKDLPVQYVIEWNASHPRLDGRTLVLDHRRQIQQAEGRPDRAIEHYALVTGRWVPSR